MKAAFQPLLHDILREAAEQHADKIAIEWRSHQVSYTPLEAASNHAVKDHIYPEKRLRLMIEEAPPRCFLPEEKFAAKLRGIVVPDDELLFLLADKDSCSTSLPEQTMLLKKKVPTHTLPKLLAVL